MAKRCNQLLGLSHAQLLFDHSLGRGDLVFRVFQAKDRLGVATGEQAVAHIRLNLGWQLDESQRVGHCGAVFADLGGDFLLREVELVHQLRIALGLLDGVEIFTLEILDKRQLKRRPVVHVSDDDRHRCQSGHLRGAPAPFTGDQLVAALARAHDQWLHDAILANRLC